MVRGWRLWAAIGAAVALAVVVAPSAYPADDPAEGVILGAGASSAVAGQYIVVLKATDSLAAEGVAARAATLAKRYQGIVGHVYSVALTGFSANMSEDQARKLAADPAVAYVQQDQIYTVAGTQDDPSWGLDRIDQRSPDLDRMYHHDIGGTRVIAYILDTGIRFTHNDFDGIGGRDRAVSGWDFVTNDPDADDCNGHGTGIASVVGGQVHGVAKSVRLVSVRVMNCMGKGVGSVILEGVEFVARQTVRPIVVNFSMTGDCADETGRSIPCPLEAGMAIREAITRSMGLGIHWVIAAGNSNADACQTAFQVAGAITVGATTPTDTRWAGSNWGRCVDLFAPGVGIAAAHNTSDTAVKTDLGTSYSAPYVTGVVARILAQPDWRDRTPAEVATELTANWVTVDRISGLDPASPNRIVYSNPPPAAGGVPLAVARNANGRLDLYGIAPDGALLMRTQTTSTSTVFNPWTTAATTGWYALGAHNDRDQHIELFGLRRKGGDLWHRTKHATGAWTTWQQHEGTYNAVSVATLDDGRLHAFATTSQGHARYRQQLTAGTREFGPWEDFSLSGAPLRGIWTDTNGNGLIEAFALTSNGNIWHRWQQSATGTAYSGWLQLDGSLATLTLTRTNTGALALFGVDRDGNVLRRTALPGTNTWSSWGQIPRTGELEQLTALAAETRADGRIALFGVDILGQLWHTLEVQPGSATYTSWLQLDGTLRPF